MSFDPDSKIKVVVIGAGAAGLCAIKHLSCQQDKFEVVAHEQQDDIGGTWRYTEEIGTDKYGLPIHSSMYENLKTNLPKEVMAFPDFPFRDCDGQSFIHHTAVLEYLKDYAVKYGLLKYIKFQSIVKDVRPVFSSSTMKWSVQVQNLINKEETMDEYDSVMVCNGHYSVPHMPDIDGIDKFKGILRHSHDYRNNIQFSDMKVVVLGAGASGIDIAIEIAAAAKEVVLSHNLHLRTCPLPKNLTQEPGISRIDEKSLTFLNQKTYFCDAILFCTGYLYTYPFLDSCDIQVGDQHVEPFFKHLFHAKFPTLGVWAIPKQIVPFPIYDQQCLVFLKFLKGDIKLPSYDDMVEDIKADFSSRLAKGMKSRHAHTMPGELQWMYDDQLSALGAIPPIPNAIRKLFRHVHTIRKQDVLNYKKYNFKILDSEEFIALKN